MEGSNSRSKWACFAKSWFSWKKKKSNKSKSKVVDITAEEYKYDHDIISFPTEKMKKMVRTEGADAKTKEFAVLAIGGSLREHSRSRGLLDYAKKRAETENLSLKIDIVPRKMIEDLPKYNPDTEKDENTKLFIAKVKAADCILFGCPEYNFSVSGPLKDALDWAGGLRENNAWDGKPAAILSVGGQIGDGCRASYHLRQIGIRLNLFFINYEVFTHHNPDDPVNEHFNDKGELVDNKMQERVFKALQKLQDLAEKFYT